MARVDEEDEEDSTSRTSLEEPLLIRGPVNSCCSITVEPILFSIFFCNSLTGSVTVNFLELRTCLQNKYNCSEPFNTHVESLVQPSTAHMLMYMSLIQAVIPSMLSFFIGPWSDTNGRKPFLLISLAGYTFYYLLWSILTVMPDVHVFYFLFPSTLIAISGGLVALFTCVNSYIGDISNFENRAFRFTMVTSSFMAGIMTGYLISAELFATAGVASYRYIYITAATICFLTLMYTLFLIPETVRKRPEEREHFFNFVHIKNMLAVVLEKRPGHGRAIIIIMAVILLCMIITVEGELAVKYLALKKAFSWTLEEYNLFAAGSTFVCVLTSVVGISVLRRVLGVPDLVISIGASLFWAISNILLGISQSTLQFCLFSILGSFATLVGPTLRSEMSKIVPQSDLGKVFAFDSALESLSTYAASPLYTLVYTAVLTKMPLAVYLLSAGICFLIVLLILLIISIQNCCGKAYLTMPEERTNIINETLERER